MSGSMTLNGYLVVELDGGKQLTINASQFVNEEDGKRHLGGGDYQYECFYIYSDEGYGVEITISGSVLLNDSGYPDGQARTFDASTLGLGDIVEDELYFEVKNNECFDDFD